MRWAGLVGWLVAWALSAAPAKAQLAAIRVYSELQRIDPFGQVIRADRPRDAAVRPREILSPAVARNAHSTFRAAVTLPAGSDYTLYVAQNPDDVFRVTLYREIFVRQGGGWIPDTVEVVPLPARGTVPGPSAPVPGQTTITFLVDLWTAASRPVSRVRVELQLYTGGDWIIYPMEVRISPATVPSSPPLSGKLPPPGEPADATAREALRTYLCGLPGFETPDMATGRGLLLRNVWQDLALARTMEAKPGDRLLPEILRLAGVKATTDWCTSPVFPAGLGPEWYLRLRDLLYRMAQ
ncbi:MAG: hypothetical protein ACUVXB_10325 [Bryobacteraceae bacterium]